MDPGCKGILGKANGKIDALRLIFDEYRRSQDGVGIWLAISAATWYLAGLYQMEILSLIFMMELLLFGAMFLFSLYTKSRICADLILNEPCGLCRQKAEGRIRIQNQGQMPALKVLIRLRWQNNLSRQPRQTAL